jgi:copper chaperone CopZ
VDGGRQTMVYGPPSIVKGFSMIKKTFKIPDMTCSNCAMKLEGLEDDLDGVKEINASYHRLEMVIEYDESKLTEEQIVTAVKKKGYQAVPVK